MLVGTLSGIAAGGLIAGMGWLALKISRGVHRRRWRLAAESWDNVCSIPFVKPTSKARQTVLVNQGHRCANPYCRGDLRYSSPHWDHIKPRAKGGTDSILNLQALCYQCNLDKGQKNWPEFLKECAVKQGRDPDDSRHWDSWVVMRHKVKNALIIPLAVAASM